MLRFPNAKINLGLFITNRREDGYHDLETVFFPVLSMQDALEVVPVRTEQIPDGNDKIGKQEVRLHQTGLFVGSKPEYNLVWKAYQRLLRAFPEKIQPIDIHLHKTIPMGAGLGGGSADAAFLLTMLNDQFDLRLSNEQLESIALELGSDCPFFIRNSPQFAKGRGELMDPIDLDLSNYRIEVVCPKVHVSTRAAFSRVVAKPASFDLRRLPEIPVEEWKNVLKNDFEESVFQQFPEIEWAKREMYSRGAVYASMSGSGSAVYGVFR
jgi:4-diphosphocytidyl-2-C-methyl-D-erythritol kinase